MMYFVILYYINITLYRQLQAGLRRGRPRRPARAAAQGINEMIIIIIIIIMIMIVIIVIVIVMIIVILIIIGVLIIVIVRRGGANSAAWLPGAPPTVIYKNKQ